MRAEKNTKAVLLNGKVAPYKLALIFQLKTVNLSSICLGFSSSEV